MDSESSTFSQVPDDKFESEVFLKSTGKAAILLLLPYLLAFLFQSNTLLRVYIALLIAPNPDVHPVEPEKSSNNSSSTIESPTFGSKWRTISTILVLSILSVAQFANIMLQSHPNPSSEASPETMDVIVILAVQVFYPGKDVVHRTSNGHFVLLRLGGFTAGQPLFLIVSLILSIGIFASLMVAGISKSNNTLSIAVVTTAYVALLSTMMSALPLRRLVAVYSCFVTAIFLLLIKYADASTFKSEGHESIWTSNIIKGPGFASFLPVTLGSIWLGPLIAYVLRFDFTKHCVTEPRKISYESVTYRSSSSDTTIWTWMNPHQRLGRGIVVPENLPYSFPKPYYTLVLATWTLIRLTTLALCLAKVGFPITSVYDASALGIFFEFPILVIVLFIFAAMRGEARDLWNYKEKWSVNLKPSASILEKGEALLANNEDKTDGKILVQVLQYT